MSNFLFQGGLLLLQVVFHFLAITAALRFAMRATLVSPRAPLSPFVIAVTRPFIRVLGLFMPMFSRFELASFGLLWLAVGAQLAVSQLDISLTTLSLVSVLKAFQVLVNVLFFAVLMRALMSWISPDNPLADQVLIPLTHWLEAPVRRFIPQLGGLDLSPVAIIFFLQVMDNMVLQAVINRLLLSDF